MCGRCVNSVIMLREDRLPLALLNKTLGACLFHVGWLAYRFFFNMLKACLSFIVQAIKKKQKNLHQ